MSVFLQYQKILEEVRNLKPVESPEIIAVSKTKSVELIRKALVSGIHRFGENKISEALQKFNILKDEGHKFELHHIGPVQTGTLRKLFSLFHFTHGIGSLSTLNELVKQSISRKYKIGYFLQVNTTLENAKSGFTELEAIQILKNLKIYDSEYAYFVGLMTMGPSNEDLVQTKQSFQKLNNLKKDYAPSAKLSMGMSGDFLIAVQEGSDFLRIGSAIFGDRV